MNFTVDVQPDFIQRLASVSGKPLTGLLELVWNALDADATEVVVSFEENKLDGLVKIRVKDNGGGIDPEHVQTYFGSLGGSWKQAKRHTPLKRVLHGSQGKGRFKAFGLGGRVQWSTTFGNPRVRYMVVGRLADIKNFEMSTPVAAPPKAATGTEVTIENVESNFPSLRGVDAVQNVAEATAIYLEQYPGITLQYDGRVVDPKAVQEHRADYHLGSVATDDGEQAVKLLVIEWTTAEHRKHERPPSAPRESSRHAPSPSSAAIGWSMPPVASRPRSSPSTTKVEKGSGCNSSALTTPSMPG